ncbi:MAG: hypothetical protein HFH34_13460 [Eubacterium sp.]|nr:hypothetical protein [Eubacterium sp.]
MDELMRLYRTYAFDCPLTLEIREEDYQDCRNYRKTKEMLEKVAAEYGMWENQNLRNRTS